MPMSTDREYLIKGFNYSIQVGDYPYATFAAFHLISSSYLGNMSLSDGLAMSQDYLEFGRTGKNIFFNVNLFYFSPLREIFFPTSEIFLFLFFS
jgi:hypothetical protein